MDEDAVLKELYVIGMSEDIENSDCSNDSIVLVPPSSVSNTYSTMDNNFEKKKEDTLKTIHRKSESKSLEQKTCMEKNDIYFREKIVNYINSLEKIIHEDETRYEIFEESHEPSIYIYEQHSLNIPIENIEIILNKLNEYVVRKLNKYFEELGYMDNRILNLTAEISNMKDVIAEKDLIIKNSPKYKKEKILESGDKYQSLKDVERVSKRFQAEVIQLKLEVKHLEEENSDFQHSTRTLKKDLRNQKNLHEELQDNYNDLLHEKEVLARENKKLKKSQKQKYEDSSELEENMSKLKNKIDKYKERLVSKNEEIATLREKINEKDNKLNSMEMSASSNIKESLKNQREESEIEDLKKKLQNMVDKMKQMDEVSEAREMELNNTIKKKELALEKIHQQCVAELSEKKTYMEKSILLEEKLAKVEKDLENKTSAIQIMKTRMKNTSSLESDLENMKKIQMSCSTKELENKQLTKKLNDMTEKFKDKERQFELIKKEKVGIEKELQNLKLLNFTNKDIES